MNFEDLIEECFKSGEQVILHSNNREDFKVGETVRFPNTTCEFEYDCFANRFETTMYSAICDVEFIDCDFKNYKAEKSNNGGCYAFADAVITKIYEVGY